MNLEERAQLKEDVEFIKKLSEAMANSKKEAQHIRGSLNRIVKAGTDYEWFSEKYDELLNSFIANEFALKELAVLLNMELKVVSKPGSAEESRYTLTVEVYGNPIEIPLTEEQYVKLARLCFLKKSQEFIKENKNNKKEVS